MKTLVILFLAFAGFTTADSKLTDAEKLVAMTELTDSHDKLLSSISGLSEAQLNFKSSPDSWSIAECVEHIATAENNIFGMMQASLKTAADASRRSEVKLSDEQVLKMITNRTNKVKTQEAGLPTGKYGSFEGSVKEFKTKRVNSIKYVANTQDDLRNHYSDSPIGTLDAYQMLLLMSAHTERHTAQIEEVKANPNFPSK